MTLLSAARADAPPASPRPLIVLFALHLLASGAYMTYFSYQFDYGERVIALHLCVVAAILSAAALALGPIVRRGSATARGLVTVGAAAWAATLGALYAANILSTSSWGQNVTIDLTSRYITRPWLLAGYVSAVTSWPRVALVLLAVLLVAVVCIRSNIVVRALGSASGHLRGWPVPRVMAVVGLAAVLAGVVLVRTFPPGPRAELLAREPVIGFLFNDVSFHRFALSRIATEYRSEGPAARAAYPKGLTFAKRNVILIIADSIRADHVPMYGYGRPITPFLDRLKQSGRVRQVGTMLATCPASNCAISSVLTSKTFANMVPENFGLHELLRDQGYTVNFILAADHHLLGLSRVYGDAVSLMFDGPMSKRYAPTDDRLLFEGLEQVAPFSGTPTMFYFHLMSAHVLGVRDDRFRRYLPDVNLGVLDSYAGVDLQAHINSYDNGILQADHVIEQLFGALDRMGYLKDALVVITSDHGEGLGEHGGQRGHAFNGRLYQEFLKVPVLIYDTADANYRNLEWATQVDLAPTIASRLALPVPSVWEGRSLLEPEPRPYSYHFMDMYEVPLYAVVRHSGASIFKYLRQFGREELFDLATDPAEQHDQLPTADPAVVRSITDRLSSILTSLE